MSQWNFALSMSLAVATSLLWLILAFFVLSASVFQGQSRSKKSFHTFLPFVAKSLALDLIVLAILAPIFFVLAAQAPFAFFPTSATFEAVTLFPLVFFAGATVILSTVFALFGTWLPATVHGINPLFSQAATRGIHTFWHSSFRIIAILIVWPLVSWGLNAATVSSAPVFMGGPSGVITLFMILVATLNYVTSAILVTLMMVALSENYSEGEGLLQAVTVTASQQ